MSGSVGRVAVGAMRSRSLSQAGGVGSSGVLQAVAMRVTSKIRHGDTFICDPSCYYL